MARETGGARSGRKSCGALLAGFKVADEAVEAFVPWYDYEMCGLEMVGRWCVLTLLRLSECRARLRLFGSLALEAVREK